MGSFTDALATLPEAVFADVLESPEAFLLVFDVPGVTDETLDVTVTANRLSVEARRRKDVPEDFWFRNEARPLFLDIEIPLPPNAAGGAATAHLESGVLEVTVPKTSESPTEVPIEG